MTQADRAYAAAPRPTSATYFLGSVLSGGGSDAARQHGAAGWADDVRPLPGAARSQTRLQDPAALRHRRRARPQQRASARSIFPHNIGLGCTRDAGARRGGRARHGRGGARHRHRLDVRALRRRSPRDERWGRTYEGFGETPELVVASWAAARGCRAAYRAARILACAKHYLADGGTAGRRSTRATRAMRRGDAARASTCPATAPRSRPASARSWPPSAAGTARRCTATSYLLTDVLKGELGFEGFVDLRLGRRSTSSRATTPRDVEAVDQRRHRHGHGARDATASSSPRCKSARRSRATCRWRASTTPCGASCA